MKNKAEKSNVLKEYNIKRIYNNIDLKDFNIITQNTARSILKISTKKQIILYGAQNPQSKRKGWDIFVETLKKLDKQKYFLLILPILFWVGCEDEQEKDCAGVEGGTAQLDSCDECVGG